MKRFLKDKRINNTWAVIKLSDLPDNMPVITVREYPTKSLAEFHLEEYCLVPRSLSNGQNDEPSVATKMPNELNAG